MKISTFTPYTDSSYPVNGTGKVNGLNSYSRSQSTALTASSDNSNGSIITSKEREFFINMFPQNTEQLENHVVFNRNGKLQSTNVAKGKIVDGRV